MNKKHKKKKAMAQKYIVFNYNGNNLYLIGEITDPGGAISYQWGSEDAALVEFDTQELANEKAAQIGGGTAGTPKP